MGIAVVLVKSLKHLLDDECRGCVDVISLGPSAGQHDEIITKTRLSGLGEEGRC